MRLPGLDRKLRFALVGCGRISGKRIDALAAHAERAELVAVCEDLQAQRAIAAVS